MLSEGKTMKKLIFSLLLLVIGASGLSHPAQADTPAPRTHLLWKCVDGTVSLWTVGDDGSVAYKQYGPYAGWTATALADGADGVTTLIWTHTSDGKISLWKLDSAGNPLSNEYGPYPGWSAVALSRFAPGIGGLTGAAGGDLFGIYPNPTVAPNAIGHTKLASDAASLAQVSAGLLSNPDGFNVVVQHDMMVKGTNLYLNGNGGGLGNSNKRGLALVDGGPGGGGLVLDYQNDFGQVNIGGSTTINGTLGVTSDISSTGTNFYLHGNGGGVGNNLKRGLALVDGGPGGGGLVISYQNDFGQVNIESSTTITGTLGVTSDISCVGQVSAKSLQLTGGSDVAEPYKIAASQNVSPLPGMVVSIDPAQTGQMRVCTRAYDPAVGGIISGANGIHPGVVLRQAGTVADGALPIASLGRVWCWCDADAGGAITPGDLLTTSDTPGHAMRASDYGRAKGAILGKAMSPLKTGRGLVLVLVTLE